MSEAEYTINHAIDGWPICKDGEAIHSNKAILAELHQLQTRLKELEVINLGLTKTLLEEESEKAKLVEALEPFAACADELDGYPADGVEPSDDNEWASFRLLVSDYRRARAALAAYRKED